MRYFTPERYVTLQDFSSDAAMNAADAAWEQAVEEYDDYYRSVESALPAEFRQLQDSYFLNDASVLYLGQHENRFVIAVRLEPPPHQILHLTYDLAGEARINRDALPSVYRDQRTASWLHDEIELVSEHPLLCVHSILFSNGWEVQLPFRALQIEEVQALFPAPLNGLAPAGTAAQIETGSAG